MTTMTAAMAAKASGEVLTGTALDDIIARIPSDAGRGGNTETNPQRQRQVGLG